MAVDRAEVSALKGILWPDEKVLITVRQRRVGPGGSITTPTSVIATDKRILIVNKATLGMRKDYESIPYGEVTSVRLEHGMISSSVFIRVQGYSREAGLLKNGKEEGEIDGLRNSDAAELADHINQILDNIAFAGVQHPQATPNLFCTKCGAKNLPDSAYCGKCGARIAPIGRAGYR